MVMNCWRECSLRLNSENRLTFSPRLRGDEGGCIFILHCTAQQDEISAQSGMTRFQRVALYHNDYKTPSSVMAIVQCLKCPPPTGQNFARFKVVFD